LGLVSLYPGFVSFALLLARVVLARVDRSVAGLENAFYHTAGRVIVGLRHVFLWLGAIVRLEDEGVNRFVFAHPAHVFALLFRLLYYNTAAKDSGSELLEREVHELVYFEGTLIGH
jgi:hypothetical protein